MAHHETKEESAAYADGYNTALQMMDETLLNLAIDYSKALRRQSACRRNLAMAQRDAEKDHVFGMELVACDLAVKHSEAELLVHAARKE